MKNESLLKIMKKRIIRSYRWREDIVIPLSKELEISPEQFEDIMIKRLDMSSLEALHARFEQSKSICIKEKIHADLRLCWLCDIMEILSEDEASRIKNKIAKEVIEGRSYEDAIEDGRKELLEFLMR